MDERTLRFLYETAAGRRLADGIFSRRFVSRITGWWLAERAASRGYIEPFIKQFAIAIDEFESLDYANFNEFFTRRYKPSLRPFDPRPEVFPAFAEGRVLGFDRLEPEHAYPVKGQFLTASALLESSKNVDRFVGGPVVIMRLAPQDYHRFHYADDGEIVESYTLSGRLHSVNPVALAARPNVLCSNERHVTIQSGENLGLIAYIDVGAMTVGRIEQNHREGYRARRGEDKGCFRCGGSTIVALGEPGKWNVDPGIREWTSKRTETLVTLGTPIGKRRCI